MVTYWLAVISAVSQLPQVPMPAVSKWMISSSEAECHLVRDFSDKQVKVRLDVSLVPTQPTYTILETASGPFVSPRSRNTGDASITSFPKGIVIRAGYITLGSNKLENTTEIFANKAEIDQTGAADSLTISANDSRTVSVKSLSTALTALNKCGTDLLTQWRSSVAPSVPTVVAVAKPTLIPEAFGPNSYPADALRRKAEGVSVALLSIDTKGRVAQCTIVRSAGDVALDGATCGAMRGVRSGFYPAQDAQGVPIPSMFILPVLWTSSEHAAAATMTNPGSVIVTSR